MKRKNFITIIVCSAVLIIFLILNGNINLFSNSKFKDTTLILKSKYDHYFKNESIWLAAKLINRNNTQHQFKGVFQAQDGLIIIVKNDKGQEIRKGINEFVVPIDTSILLNSNDSLENKFNLDWYDLRGTNFITVKAEYNGIQSNEIKLIYKQPVGEDLQVLKAIEENDKMRDDLKISRELVDNKAIEIINRYPNSRYIPDLYNKLLLSLLTFNSDNVKYEEYFDKYMTQYRDEDMTKVILPTYLVNINVYKNNLTETQKIEEFRKLVQRYNAKNTEFEKQVEELVKENSKKGYLK